MAALAEGYEPLLDGQGKAQPQQQPRPTFTQPSVAAGTAGAAQPAAAAPGTGAAIPALRPQQAGGLLGRHSQLAQLPPFADQLAQLPSAAEEWERATVLMSVWLATSTATLVMALLSFNALAVLGATSALVGASIHRFAPCRGPGGLAGWVHKVHTLAIAAACFTGVVASLSLLVAAGLGSSCEHSSDPTACAELTEATLLYGLWFVLFTGLTAAIVRRTHRMRLLLNPVSSGLVEV